MNFDEYEKLEKFEQNYWWHQGRFYLLSKLIEKYLPTKKVQLFEVGCGTGQTLEFLSKYGIVTCNDISPVAVDYCKKKGFGNVILGDINDLSLAEHTKKYSGVFALDVLEHIQDDVKAMQTVKELLKPDGVFILTVPAHKFLWSEHDEALHHKRRYHWYEIKQKLADAGFEVVKQSYFVATAFFPILAFRTWNNIFGKSVYPKTSYVELSPVLNTLATNFLKVETKVFEKFGLPIGTTIVVVAKRSR